jgi:hypothetical protein
MFEFVLIFFRNFVFADDLLNTQNTSIDQISFKFFFAIIENQIIRKKVLTWNIFCRIFVIADNSIRI